MYSSWARVALLTLSFAAACATGGRTVATDEAGGEVEPSRAAAPVLIRVSSQYAAPLAIYSVSDGVATRLGDVPGGRVEQFRLDAVQIPADGLTLLAVPLAGDARATTGRLRVVPGNVIDFTIGTALTNAAAAVRSP